jgi:hypothetical protein
MIRGSLFKVTSRGTMTREVVCALTAGLMSSAMGHGSASPFLRRGWINLDLVWIAALVVSGAVLLII